MPELKHIVARRVDSDCDQVFGQNTWPDSVATVALAKTQLAQACHLQNKVRRKKRNMITINSFLMILSSSIPTAKWPEGTRESRYTR